MADANQFYRDFRAVIDAHIRSMDTIVTMQDRLNSDPTLAGAAASAASALGRTDLAAIDFTNAASAIGQLAFAFNSGSPTQKSFLYKIL